MCADLFAEGLESKAPKLVVERPNPSGPPTEVKIGIYLLDIADINDVQQLFSVDLFVDVDWHDPRLAVPEGKKAWKKAWTPTFRVSRYVD